MALADRSRIAEFLDDLTHPVRKRISNAVYWFKYRMMPSHQYHLVRTGLPPGYYDDDTRILHACMRALSEYVEIGCDGETAIEKFNVELRDPATHVHGTGQGCLDQAARQEEALAIYRWWKYQKPADEKRKEIALDDWHDNRNQPGDEGRWEALQALEKQTSKPCCTD